jgi:hypothetical protein
MKGYVLHCPIERCREWMMQEKNDSLHQYEGEKERGGNMHVNTGFPFFYERGKYHIFHSFNVI